MRLRPSAFVLLIAVGCSGPVPQRGPANVDPDGLAGRLQWLCGWGEPASVSSACVERESLAPDEPEQEATAPSSRKPSKPPSKRLKSPPPTDRKPTPALSASAPAPVTSPAPVVSAAPPPPKAIPHPPPPPPPPDNDDDPISPPDFPIE